MIIDSHAHIYPRKIAGKATANIGRFYDQPIFGDGLPSSLNSVYAKSGISKALVFSVATAPSQVESINTFIYEKCQKYNRFIPVGTMHPEYADFRAEIKRIKELGFVGIKLHPDFQKFNIDDSSLFPMYDTICGAGLPIIFHLGDDRFDFSHPKRLANLAKAFPRLTCVGAHMGGYLHWKDSVSIFKGIENTYFDTSSSLEFLSSEEAHSIIREIGVDHFLFASDYPMWNPEKEIGHIMNLPLSESDRKKIFSENCIKVFNLK